MTIIVFPLPSPIVDPSDEIVRNPPIAIPGSPILNPSPIKNAGTVTVRGWPGAEDAGSIISVS